MPRPKTPNALLKLAGSKHERKSEPEFSTALGFAPSVLQGKALEVWDETVGELKTVGIGTRVEAHMLSAYCQAVADFSEAQKEIDRDGMTVATERGMTKHPAYTIKTQAWGAMLKFGSQFGLSPASRGKIVVTKAEEEDEFGDL